jgi:hypothetical protein
MAVLNSVNSLSDPLSDGTEMNSNAKSWLQLYVDALTQSSFNQFLASLCWPEDSKKADPGDLLRSHRQG